MFIFNYFEDVHEIGRGRHVGAEACVKCEVARLDGQNILCIPISAKLLTVLLRSNTNFISVFPVDVHVSTATFILVMAGQGPTIYGLHSLFLRGASPIDYVMNTM